MAQLNWSTFTEQCKNCTACGLAATRKNVVVGVGLPNAQVMFIGEGPGEQEDIKGEPFVGRGGQLLDKMLAAVGLSRKHNIYIANIVKCRPPNNRDPLPDEQETCINWLRSQVSLIRPKIIVCLGRVAACRIIDPNFKVTRQHGEFVNKGGILMMGTFHPAAILRNPNLKPAAFEDFVKLRDKITEICKDTKLVY
jgi:uracil-DNA glycosylase family 4